MKTKTAINTMRQFLQVVQKVGNLLPNRKNVTILFSVTSPNAGRFSKILSNGRLDAVFLMVTFKNLAAFICLTTPPCKMCSTFFD